MSDLRRPLPRTYENIDLICVLLSLCSELKSKKKVLAHEGILYSNINVDLSRIVVAWVAIQSSLLPELFTSTSIAVSKEPNKDSDSDYDSDSDSDSDLDNSVTVDDNQSEPKITYLGTESVEVISVVIKMNNETRSHIGGVVSLYGKISVDDGRYPQVVYRKERMHPESISMVHGGRTSNTLLLTGLSDYLLDASDTVTINVELMAKVDNLPTDKDVVISNGKIVWHPFSRTARVFEEEKAANTDRPKVTINYYPHGTEYIDKILAGNVGSATVEYIIFSDAVKATVVVTLFGKNNKPAIVYGNMDAVGVCGSKIYKIVLFNKKNDDDKNIPVHPKQTICLSRSILAIGPEHPLQVSANLYDGSQDNVCIAKGDAYFPRQGSGESRETILGTSPWGIEVKVTWSVG